MKCKTCGYEIPSGKNYCPGCGRVLSKLEQEQIAQNPLGSQYGNSDSAPKYRRPASVDDTTMSENIKAIFSADADAPAYHDPHTYKSATAHALEYDKTYVQRKASSSGERVYNQPTTENKSGYNEDSYSDDTAATRKFTPVQNTYDETDYVDREDYETETKKKIKINPIYLLICIIVVVGLAIIVVGGYNVGKQIGLWGETEDSSESYEDNDKTPTNDKAPVVNVPDKNPDVDNTADYKIGTYTVNAAENNILLYKNDTLDQIIATIPNLSVVEITEIKEESGKCKFGTYTGWLDMKLLLYTPDAKLPEETTANETTTAPETTTADSETTTAGPTQPSHPTETGTYTVDLRGDGQVLNVRSEATINADAVTTITDGTVVTVSQVSGDWGYITTADGHSGWVYMIYLK